MKESTFQGGAIGVTNPRKQDSTPVVVNEKLVHLTGLVLDAHSAIEHYMFDKTGICNYPYEDRACSLDQSMTDVTSTLVECIGMEVVDEIRKTKKY